MFLLYYLYMNLIKFKETIVPGQDWYNANLRGKYAYWIRCRYVVPLESITNNMCVRFENDINDLLAYDYWGLVYDEDESKWMYKHVDKEYVSEYIETSAVLVESVPTDPDEYSDEFVKTCHNIITYIDLWEGNGHWANAYVDAAGCESANSVDIYKAYNAHIPNDDVDPEELKQFRTWLAFELLGVNYTFYQLTDDAPYEYMPVQDPSLEQMKTAVEVDEVPEPTAGFPAVIKIKDLDIVNYDEDTIHMLEYYANDMWDDTLKWLKEFASGIKLIDGEFKSTSCGCGGSSNISSLYNDSLNTCNTMDIYKNGLKSVMVNMFSKIETWANIPSSYIVKIKRYVDDIIQHNFPLLTKDDYGIYSCECLRTSSGELGSTALKQLSSAFGYIISGGIDSRKNFIATTLNVWAKDLYEIMEW